MKAAEYCAKASDPGSICFSKSQTTFFQHGANRKDSIVKAAEYCAKANVRKECARARMRVAHRRAPKCTMHDAVLKAAEYCAKTNDSKGICLSKAQTTLFNYGPNRKDSIVKAAEYCAKANVRKVRENICLFKGTDDVLQPWTQSKGFNCEGR